MTSTNALPPIRPFWASFALILSHFILMCVHFKEAKVCSMESVDQKIQNFQVNQKNSQKILMLWHVKAVKPSGSPQIDVWTKNISLHHSLLQLNGFKLSQIQTIKTALLFQNQVIMLLELFFISLLKKIKKKKVLTPMARPFFYEIQFTDDRQ